MKIVISLTIIGVAMFLGACQKGERFKQVNTTSDNIAIKGYDPVAYSLVESAVEGNPQFSLVWNGAKWYFSNPENLEKFKENPEAFAPQFGGYCAYAVSKGYTADGDPNTWKIVDGKLYLNYSPKAQELWEKDRSKAIEDGKKNWKEFETKTPEHK